MNASEASVLVLSDTHLTRGSALPVHVLELADRADHVIHAGDHSTIDVHRTLAALAPTTSVAGNVEDGELVAAVPHVAEVEIADVRFAVVHDGGHADGRHARLRSRFPSADVIVYGHSHQPEIATLVDGGWIVNPGSPTQRRRAPTHTVAWATLRDGSVVTCELVELPS